MNFKSIVLGLSSCALVVSCGKSSKSEAPRISNRASAEEFKTLNHKALNQVNRASGLSVPYEKKQSAFHSENPESRPRAGVSEFLANFAGATDEMSATEDSKDCSFNDEVTGSASDMSESASSKMSLATLTDPNVQEGQDCASAIKSIQTTYDTSLKLVRAQNAFMEKLEGRSTFCGMNIRKLDVDQNEAAMGFELTKSIKSSSDLVVVDKDGKQQRSSSSPSINADLTIELKGGAVNDRVNFIGGFAVKGTSSTQNAVFELSMNQETAIETALETLESNFTSSGKATGGQGQEKMAISFGGQSVGKIYGLKANEIPTATEDNQITVNVSGAEQNGTLVLKSNAKARQTTASTLTLDGTMTVEVNGNGQQQNQTLTYSVVLEKNADNTCTVKKKTFSKN